MKYNLIQKSAFKILSEIKERGMANSCKVIILCPNVHYKLKTSHIRMRTWKILTLANFNFQVAIKVNLLADNSN